MKTKLKQYLSALFLLISLSVYSQTGIQCVECGGMNGNHKPTCSSYNRASSGTSTSGKLNFQEEIMMNLFSRLLTNSVKNNQQTEQQKAQKLAQEKRDEDMRQQRLAILLTKQKRYNDSVAHARMMKDYKPLEGSSDLSYKGLDDNKPKQSIVHFNCKITSFQGKVIVLKSNGQQIILSETQSADLAPGDWIATGENSRIKLHYAFESGGKDMILHPKSAISIETGDNGDQEPNLMKGKMYMVDDDKFVQSKIAEMALDANNALANGLGNIKASLKNEMNRRIHIRTPSAVLADRGTEFTVNVDDFNVTEVNVKNGIVDLTNNLKNKTITLTEGTKGIVKATGEIIGPLEMNETQFDDKDDN